jgi:hypothetical protein
MSILSQKQKVFGDIAAFRTLTEGLPSLKTSSSFPSINNNGDSIAFLCDLIKALIGYDALQETVVTTLVYSLKDIEREIKNSLKLELKSIVSCGVNPSLPSFIKSSGPGIKVQVPKVDFTNLMLVDPRSTGGKMLYNDLTTNLLDSSDFNTFLYQTIQNNGTIQSWGHTTAGADIITVRFDAQDISNVNPNNTLTIKAHPTYDSKTLTDLNNDYIDSITLFNTENLVNNVIDMVFGTISTTLGKSLKQLTAEAQINTVIDKIVSSDNRDVINDSYFTFTPAQVNAQNLQATSRQIGQKPQDTSAQFTTSVPFAMLSASSASIASTTNQLDKRDAVISSLNTIGNQVALPATNPVDNAAMKLNFIQEIVNNLIKGIVNSILSPKVITIFLINYKIVYGPAATFTDSVDFLKKNKNLIHNITKTISTLIIKTLLTLAMKQIATLVAEAAAKQLIDKAQSNLTQLLSLVGVPQETLRLILGLL